MTINSRAKGARGEREWASYLRDQGWTAERGAQHAGRAKDTRGLVSEAPDVLTNCPHLSFEVKRVEKLQLDNAMAQAISDSEGLDVFPVVAHRKNNSDWLITLRADDFFKIYNESELSQKA
jgi:Holliday junction resolvase